MIPLFLFVYNQRYYIMIFLYLENITLHVFKNFYLYNDIKRSILFITKKKKTSGDQRCSHRYFLNELTSFIGTGYTR